MLVRTEDLEEGCVLLRMDSGEQHNVFSTEFVTQLLAALNELSLSCPKVVILAGRSDVFCAGGDQDALKKLAQGEMLLDDLRIADRLLSVPFPIIAVMEGHAIGGGLALASYCDMVFAANESRYGAVFMNMGFTPGMGSTTLLPLLFGPYLAAEMMYSGKRFKGSELAQRGAQLNYIGAKESLMPLVIRLAASLTEKPKESLYLLKHSLSAVKKKLMLEARQQEDLMHRLSFSFPETQKRIQEFY